VTSKSLDFALGCPMPLPERDRIQLGHGSGGRMSANLLKERFLPAFPGEVLRQLGDGASLILGTREIVVSTDSFVVTPLEFPGGDIGDLAVNGTVNDVAMMGAVPRYLCAGFILEEGLPFEVLDRVVASMSAAAAAAGVVLVAGDTKVVERGKADGMFINTTGIGELQEGFRPAPHLARPGDAVLVSGPLGCHGMAVMGARDGLDFRLEIESDTAPLLSLVAALREAVGEGVHVLRDPTRGGLASALNEIAQASGVGVVLEDGVIPIPGAVAAACEVLGLDPLYVANEGVLVAIVDGEMASGALEAMRRDPLGREAVRVGTVTADHPGLVVLRTGVGGTRIVDLLPGDQLPRIC